jgi:hypothetical protein
MFWGILGQDVKTLFIIVAVNNEAIFLDCVFMADDAYTIHTSWFFSLFFFSLAGFFFDAIKKTSMRLNI